MFSSRAKNGLDWQQITQDYTRKNVKKPTTPFGAVGWRMDPRVREDDGVHGVYGQVMLYGKPGCSGTSRRAWR